MPWASKMTTGTVADLCGSIIEDTLDVVGDRVMTLPTLPTQYPYDMPCDKDGCYHNFTVHNLDYLISALAGVVEVHGSWPMHQLDHPDQWRRRRRESTGRIQCESTTHRSMARK